MNQSFIQRPLQAIKINVKYKEQQICLSQSATYKVLKGLNRS